MAGDVDRFARILKVLAKHGFVVLDQKVVHHHDRDEVRAAQLRMAFEELGTVFIKLGQFVASQSVALPQPYQIELAKLQDDVPPIAADRIEAVIVRSLGAGVSDLFASFDTKPLGSASIGQVHAARLADGRNVVVKVKKPGVDDLVATDLSILAGFVRRLTPHVGFLRDMQADRLLPEFERTMRAELDYAAEAANVELFHHHFADDAGMAIPEVIRDRTAGDVLCETRLTGTALADAASAATDAKAREAIADKIVRLVLEPGLTIGVFHADPHAGNLLLAENGVLGVLDFGKVGKLTPRDRHQILAAFLAIGSRDADRLTTALLALSDGASVGDRDELSLRIGALLDRYGDAAIGKIGFEQALADLIGLFRSHGLVMPGRIILFFKALSMAEGLIRRIEPDARFGQLLAPAMKRMLLERIIGGEALHRLASWAFHTGTALADLPARADAALTAATTGELRVRAQLEELAPAVSRVEGMVDRLTAAVLVAAAIIGFALLVQVYRPQLPSGIAAAAWVLAGVVLSFFVRAVSRKMRRR